ncbi:MAG: radical SAM protein [Sulfuricellaceae bacterium]
MEPKALIFDIKRDCSEDGPGIRTTVFFKGCPLTCVWCQNPEGIGRLPEFDSASKPVGEWIALDELLYRLRQDSLFYRSSGGGVTLSGGEPTMQMAFAGALLKALKAEGIHTAIETCGFFNNRQFNQHLFPWLDLIYFDLKLMKVDDSRNYTGQSNRLILDNFMQLAQQSAVPVIPRVPLIPGITATAENLQSIAGFLAANGIGAATLLPYNPLWHDKAAKLGRISPYQRKTFMTQDEQQQCVAGFHPSQSEKRRPEHAN